LEEQLFTAVGKKQGHRRLAEPDWAAVHRELKGKQCHAADTVGRTH
jgi:transposase